MADTKIEGAMTHFFWLFCLWSVICAETKQSFSCWMIGCVFILSLILIHIVLQRRLNYLKEKSRKNKIRLVKIDGASLYLDGKNICSFRLDKDKILTVLIPFEKIDIIEPDDEYVNWIGEWEDGKA